MTEFKATKPIVTVFLAMMMVVVVATTVVSADWVTFQGNNNRNGVSTEAGPTSTPTQNWSAFADTDFWGSVGIDTSPIIADGKVYVIDYNGAVRAYYQDNGTVAWVHTPWVGHQSDFQLSTPAYNDGVLYVALTRITWDGTELITDIPIVKALDTTDGSEIWSYTIPEPVAVVSPVTYDTTWDQVYVATWDYYENINAKLYCIDNLVNPGDIWWIYDTGSTSGVYNSAGGSFGSFNAILFGNDDGTLFAVDRLLGFTLDTFDVKAAYSLSGDYEIHSSIATVSTGTFSAQLYFSIGYADSSTSSGHCVSVNYNYITGFSARWISDDIGFSSSTPTVYSNKVYVGTGGVLSYVDPLIRLYKISAPEHALYCLNAANGSEIWTYTANGGIQSSPVVYATGGNVYVYFTTNTGDGTAYCVKDNGSTASTVWTFLPESGKNDYILQGVALTDGKLYFGNDAGWLFAVW